MRSGSDLTMEQWDPMGFTELWLRLTDALRYKIKNPRLNWGGLLNYAGIWKAGFLDQIAGEILTLQCCS